MILAISIPFSNPDASDYLVSVTILANTVLPKSADVAFLTVITHEEKHFAGLLNANMSTGQQGTSIFVSWFLSYILGRQAVTMDCKSFNCSKLLTQHILKIKHGLCKI